MRGWLSFDVLAAAVLAALLLALGLGLLLARVHAFSQQARVGSALTAAYANSSRLLALCPDEGGLARCARGFVFENVLDPAAVGRGTAGRVRAPGADGAASGYRPVPGACARRIALLEGREVGVDSCAPVD
jgi:hypothetical protein